MNKPLKLCKTKLQEYIRTLGLSYDKQEKLMLTAVPTLWKFYKPRSISQKIRRMVERPDVALKYIDAMNPNKYQVTPQKHILFINAWCNVLGLTLTELRPMITDYINPIDFLMEQINAHRQTILFLSQEILGLQRQIDDIKGGDR